MTVVALIFVRRAHAGNDQAATEIQLESIVSLKRVLSFAVLFLAIQIVSTLGEHYLGKFGFLGVSVLGGLVSSASTSAAAAHMVGHGQMQANLAGAAVVLASVASAVINLPIIHRAARNSTLSKQLAFLTVVLSRVGIAILAIQQFLGFFRI
jgi:uncharacterized membrane protein (DUF4010 family)